MAGIKIALTGGIASGKSTVARMFKHLGALILDADETAKEAVRPGSQCWRNLRDFLGEEYFDPDGRLKRRKVRELIVRDAEYRRKVNSILHPAVMETMEAEWRAALHRQHDLVVIFDIPLLFEIGADRDFDFVILVYAPRETQISRLVARDGVTRQEAEKTLLIQLPIDTKKNSSHIVIDNSQDSGHTLKQVRMAWKRLKNETSVRQGSL